MTSLARRLLASSPVAGCHPADRNGVSWVTDRRITIRDPDGGRSFRPAIGLAGYSSPVAAGWGTPAGKRGLMYVQQAQEIRRAVARGTQINHSRAVARGTQINHSRAVAVAGRA